MAKSTGMEAARHWAGIAADPSQALLALAVSAAAGSALASLEAMPVFPASFEAQLIFITWDIEMLSNVFSYY